MAAKKKVAKKTAAKAKPAAKKAVKKVAAKAKPAAKPAPAAKKPAAAPAKPKLVSVPMPPIGALIANGMGLQYSMADFDVNDPYTFTIRDAGDGLAVHFQMGSSDQGDLTFTSDAIKGATKWVGIAQGGAMVPDGESPSAIRTAVPPFLVSRSVFTALRIGGGATIHSEWGGGEIDVEAVSAKRKIHVGGKSIEVPVLHATGDDLELWIVDDPTWPLVIEHSECGGDNFWKLHKIGKGLGPWSGDDDDGEESGGEDE